MTKLKISAGKFTFDAKLEKELAPLTCAAFESAMSFKGKLVHVRGSEEGVWIPLGDMDFGVTYENHTSHPAPGQIILYPDNTNILAKKVDPIEVRMRISMVFQKPNPFPKSIYENVAYGLRVRGERNKHTLDDKVEEALKGASLWEEVKDRLYDLAFNLSGGQQQRLCIARALATEPEIMLFDEPTSALDPIATVNIEELMSELKEKLSILIVTHNMQQAARISDYTAYMYLGELVEHDLTDQIFTNPSKKETEDYITGKFG